MSPFAAALAFGFFLIASFSFSAVNTASSSTCVSGIQCQTETISNCTVGSTNYCCPSGFIQAIIRNGVLQSCNCTFTVTGSSCSDFSNTNSGSSACSQGDLACQNLLSCTVGSTKYCCPGGSVTASSSGGILQSCSCSYIGGMTGSHCTSGSPSLAASASAAMLMLLITSIISI